MTDNLFKLLNELKGNFSKKALTEFLTIFDHEVSVDEMFKDQDRARKAFNGQNEEFYNQLSFLFVIDINQVPEMYFMLWEPIIGLLDVSEKAWFFQKGIEHSKGRDAEDYINGMQYLENGSPGMSMLYFNRIEDYIVSYFVGMAYMDLENYENAIIAFETFLKEINFTIKESGLIYEPGLLIAKWNTLNDLGYLYNRVEDFQKATKYYEMGLKIFPLEEVYDINSQANSELRYDDFAIWINNYVFALERTNKAKRCIDVLKFAVSKRPEDSFFQKQLVKFEKKIESRAYAEEVLDRVFKKKKPFNIGQFESTKLIAKEKALEDLILEQIKYGIEVFGKPLELYKDKRIHGRQYYIKSVNGFLDLLLIDKSTNQLYIVELKRNKAGVEVVEQIEKYMEGLSKEMKRSIKGIICVHKADMALSELVKNKEDIELYTYGFDFDKIG